MKLRLVAVSTLLGGALFQQCSHLPSFNSMLVLWLGNMVMWFLMGDHHLFWRGVRVGILAVSIGFSWTYFHAFHRLEKRIPLEDCFRPLVITGKVKGVVIKENNHLRFDLITPQRTVRLYWHQAKMSLASGDKLTLKVVLKYPHGLSNPGGFDKEKQYFKENIAAQGHVLQVLSYEKSSHLSVARIRQMLFNALSMRYSDKTLLPIIQATTLGIYGEMTPHQFEVFSKTGTLHAIAISGSHIALMAGFFAFLVYHLARQSCYLTSRYPAQHCALMASLLGAFLYAQLAGMGIPVERAFLMIMIMVLAKLKGKKVFSWDVLSLAWLVIGFFNPLSTLDTGFWLSFGCVAILIAGKSWIEGSFWRRFLLPQGLIFVGMIPFSAFFFHQIAWVSPLANGLTLPILGLLVVPLSLMAVLLLMVSPRVSDLCIAIAHSGLMLAWRVLEALAMLPLCMGVLHHKAPEKGHCRVTVLDVGQGLAVVAQTQDHALLFDTGPQYSKTQNAAEVVIRPFLKNQNITRLNAVIISHGDLDHKGGWESMKTFSIGDLYSSDKTLLEAKPCFPDTTWEWDGVHFTLLSAKRAQNRNDSSCVLKITTASHSMLITGDIEKGAENTLVKNRFNFLDSDVLVVPHHGSLSSSTPHFVSAVSPQYAVYSVGFHNRYHFPHEAILARYRKVGAENSITPEKGAITFDLGGKDLTSPRYFRDTQHRYWHRV